MSTRIGMKSFVLCLATMCLVGLIGVVRKEPWVFPSLGPTAMLFFETPKQKAASALNTVVGHGVAILVGAACLHGFGFAAHPAAVVEGLVARRVLAAALSVAATALVLRLVRLPHPPAGATTLIVSLGVIKKASGLTVMFAAVVLLTILAVAVNRLLGEDHPLVPARSEAS